MALSSGGGFEVIWDSAAGAAPAAQDYDNNGNPVGGSFALTGAPPTASFASTSLELPAVSTDQQAGTKTWTTVLPNDDSVAVTSQSNNGPGAPQMLFRLFDPAGQQVGPDYVKTFQSLPGLGQEQTTALAGGTYVATYTDNQNYSAQLYYDLFRADGTHLAGQTVATTGFAGACHRGLA